MLFPDLKAALDPVLWAEDTLGFKADPWQAEVLRSDSKRLLLNCSRQAGKSVCACLIALHTAIFQEDSLVLLVSITQRQSAEMLRTAMHAYGLNPSVPSESESALKLELVNGSRIISLPGSEKTIRGYSGVDLLILDEAARIDDDLYQSVRPMLAVSDGRLIALSTPFGTRGWWYEAWRSSEPWMRTEIPADMCPRISKEFLEEEKRTKGSYWFDQEYFCKFLEAQTQVFRREDVDAMFAEKVEVWDL